MESRHWTGDDNRDGLAPDDRCEHCAIALYPSERKVGLCEQCLHTYYREQAADRAYDERGDDAA